VSGWPCRAGVSGFRGEGGWARDVVVGGSEQLDPRGEPEPTVIDCLGAQRHNLAAVV